MNCKKPEKQSMYFTDLRKTVGVELVYGQQVIHDFIRHTHQNLCIGIVEAGIRSYCCRGANYEISPGQVFIIPPDEPHSCGRAGNQPHTYKLLVVSSNILELVLSHSQAGRLQKVFKKLVIDDAKLFQKLYKAYDLLTGDKTVFAKQALIIEVVGYLVEHYTDVSFDLSISNQNHEQVQRVQAFIEGNYAGGFSVEDIAQKVYMSPYHLIRVFSKFTGVPPHIYQQQVRIRHAKQMLISGTSIAQVAANTGFVDQSHFNRVFKKLVGVTPGEYRMHAR